MTKPITERLREFLEFDLYVTRDASPYAEAGMTGSRIEGAREERRRTANLDALWPDALSVVENFGDGITDVFEQMERGSWIDDQGHKVELNSSMHSLIAVVRSAIELRAKLEQALEGK